MKKTNALYCITAGNPKKLIKPVVWTVLADLVNLFPFGCLTLVVSSIYLYFGGTSDTLNTKQLWLVWGGMVILAIILYLFERKAVHATMVMMPAQRAASSLRNISENCRWASL